eukprot:1158380-Pelagomonas_calceolata.AAC.3
MPGSRGSGTGSIAGSTRGFRAPTNPKPSYVDESLFGGTKTQGNNSSVAKAQVGCMSASQTVEALEKAAANAKKTKAPQNVPDVVTLSKADLERMVKVRRHNGLIGICSMPSTLEAAGFTELFGILCMKAFHGVPCQQTCLLDRGQAFEWCAKRCGMQQLMSMPRRHVLDLQPLRTRKRSSALATAAA